MGSKRVVTRTSPGTPSVKGCSLSSSRPRSKGKPTAFMISTASARCLAGAELAGDGQYRLRILARQHFADQAWQAAAQRLEHRIDFRRGLARAEFIDQRVVRRQVARLAQQLRLVAHQVHDLFEVRREVLELSGFPRLQPFRLGLGGRLGEARHQRHGSCDGEIALPAHLAQIGDLPVLETGGARLRTIQQARDLRCGHQRVVFGLERRELLAANVGTAARHHHRGVPPQHRHRAPECMQAFPFLLELLVRGLGHGTRGGGRTNGPESTSDPTSGPVTALKYSMKSEFCKSRLRLTAWRRAPRKWRLYVKAVVVLRPQTARRQRGTSG